MASEILEVWFANAYRPNSEDDACLDERGDWRPTIARPGRGQSRMRETATACDAIARRSP